MVRRLAFLAALLVASVFLLGGSYDRGGYASRGGYPGSGTPGVTTFRLLVQDGTALPSAAVTAGHIDADSLNYYDQVNSDGGFGGSMRYGAVRSGAPTVPIYNANGLLTGRVGGERDQGPQAYMGFFAFNLSGLTPGHRVTEALVFLNTWRLNESDFSTGYVAVRLDTISTDYDMLNSISSAASGDLKWLDTSWDEVDMDKSTAWAPGLDDRDDMNDFGPRGEVNYINDATFGGTSGGDEGLAVIDFTDPLQQILDNGKFEEQGGWVILAVYQIGSPASTQAWGAGLSSKVLSGNPAVSVVTTNSRGGQPWGGGGLPFTLTFDDTYGEQTGYYEVMADSGLVFTSMVSETAMTASFDSLNSANQGEIYYVAHTSTHTPLGDITGAAIDAELERGFFMDSGVFTDPPDTLDIVHFCWAGGGTYNYSHEAIEKMVDFGYLTSRASTQAWKDDPTGADLYPTELSWDSPVNMYMISADLIVWEDGESERSEAEIKEYITDKIDYLYTDRGRAAFNAFTHNYTMNKTTPANLAYVVGLINSFNSIQHMSYEEALSLRDGDRIDPVSIADMDIPSADSTSIKAAAAIDDSLIAQLGHNNLLQAWAGPYRDPTDDLTLRLTYPVYGAWDNEFTAGVLTTDDYKLYAESDVSVLDHNIWIQPGYIGLVDSVRAYNPDWVPLTYVWGYGVNVAWEPYARGTFYGDLWHSVVDNDFFARTTSPVSEIIWSTSTWPGVAMLNPYAPGLADTLANIYAYHLDKQNNNRHHVGYFVDWHYTPITTGGWSWETTLADSLDMDQDGVPYGSDSDEEGYNIAYIRSFPQKYRDAADNQTLLIIPNGNVHHKIATADVFDGGMYEGVHINLSSTYPYGRAEWEHAIHDVYGMLDRTRIDPPLVMFQAPRDSIRHASEALSAIARGISCWSNAAKEIQAPTRKYDIGVMSEAPTWDGDTVTAEYLKDGITTYVRCVEQDYIWAYYIYNSDGEVLSRGGGWPAP